MVSSIKLVWLKAKINISASATTWQNSVEDFCTVADPLRYSQAGLVVHCNYQRRVEVTGGVATSNGGFCLIFCHFLKYRKHFRADYLQDKIEEAISIVRSKC